MSGATTWNAVCETINQTVQSGAQWHETPCMGTSTCQFNRNYNSFVCARSEPGE